MYGNKLLFVRVRPNLPLTLFLAVDFSDRCLLDLSDRDNNRSNRRYQENKRVNGIDLEWLDDSGHRRSPEHPEYAAGQKMTERQGERGADSDRQDQDDTDAPNLPSA